MRPDAALSYAPLRPLCPCGIRMVEVCPNRQKCAPRAYPGAYPALSGPGLDAILRVVEEMRRLVRATTVSCASTRMDKRLRLVSTGSVYP